MSTRCQCRVCDGEDVPEREVAETGHRTLYNNPEEKYLFANGSGPMKRLLRLLEVVPTILSLLLSLALYAICYWSTPREERDEL